MCWRGKHVLVTGGASFIGSHLVDELVARGASVRVADNLSSGTRANLAQHLDRGAIDFHEVDLLEPGVPDRMCAGMSIAFHLAADHGGRGYIDLHQVECATNLALDGLVLRAAARAGVEKLVFASSGCVYPNSLQGDPTQVVFLTEELVRPPYDADNLYGWAKLMCELTLRAYCEAGRLKGASVRYFTAYGPRCLENHAVMAMIARALIRSDPFEIWGTGDQIRNWTYVSDVVTATILAAERINDGSAVNVGTMERISVRQAAAEITALAGYTPSFRFDPTQPTGPLNRVCDLGRARSLLGWEPAVRFSEGVRRTFDWYRSTKDSAEVARTLPELLASRRARR